QLWNPKIARRNERKRGEEQLTKQQGKTMPMPHKEETHQKPVASTPFLASLHSGEDEANNRSARFLPSPRFKTTILSWKGKWEATHGDDKKRRPPE
ncbi:hypothetical protein ISN45_Aa08g007460, partial [Arabidopsis thaliana x Arabidopsis arenosa]